MSERGVTHIVPENDSAPHKLNADGHCWCRPALDREDTHDYFLHNAADGREKMEEKTGKQTGPDKTWKYVRLS
jgi:hypothetical protein